MPEAISLPARGLISDRVRLRPWLPDDTAALVTAWADPEIARWTAVPPNSDLTAARRWIEGDAARLAAGMAVDLVVCEPLEAAVLGEIGLGPIDWERRAAQVGYWTAAPARKRRLASAALGLLTSWAVDELSLRLLVARCHPANVASSAVASAAGYSVERSDSEGFDLHVYRASTGTC